MKVYIETWRYGQETYLEIHCEKAVYLLQEGKIVVYGHVDHLLTRDPDTYGIQSSKLTSVISLEQTDIVNVAQCSDKCPFGHKVSLPELVPSLRTVDNC